MEKYRSVRFVAQSYLVFEVAMKNSIKLGDLFLVCDGVPIEQHGALYRIGLKLGKYYQHLLKEIKAIRLQKHCLHGQPCYWPRPTDYSQYELPAVYRKWR
jgi:hypothetical protein